MFAPLLKKRVKEGSISFPGLEGVFAVVCDQIFGGQGVSVRESYSIVIGLQGDLIGGSFTMPSIVSTARGKGVGKFFYGQFGGVSLLNFLRRGLVWSMQIFIDNGYSGQGVLVGYLYRAQGVITCDHAQNASANGKKFYLLYGSSTMVRNASLIGSQVALGGVIVFG